MTASDPSVSVVVASAAGGEFLPRCLDSLKEPATRLGAEVLVVDRLGNEVEERLQRDYDWVRLIPFERKTPRPGVPELRKQGVLEARAPVVAVLEEHCTAPAGWLEAILENMEEGDAAIGGPILDDGYDRVRDWVVYFSEYNNYLPPWPEGERYLLNGANVAYRKEFLVKHQQVLDQGYWEVVLHPLLAGEGHMRSVPRMGAHHTGPFDFGYYLEQRYLLSRVWGGTQKDKVPAARRLLYLCAAPLFPALLLARIAMRVLKSGHRLGKFLVAVPLLVPVVCIYVWGEWRGYLSGVGDALERVE